MDDELKRVFKIYDDELKVGLIFGVLWMIVFVVAWFKIDETTKQIDADTAKVQIVTQHIIQPVNVSGIYKEVGEFELTAYCPCEECCEVWAQDRPGGIVYTASGAVAQEGVTVAADTRILPFGTKILIDDHVYIVQDRGGAIKGNRLDVYHASHEAALNFAKKTATVYKMVEEGGKD